MTIKNLLDFKKITVENVYSYITYEFILNNYDYKYCLTKNLSDKVIKRLGQYNSEVDRKIIVSTNMADWMQSWNTKNFIEKNL